MLRFGALTGLVVAAGAAGCGLRLERDAPSIPLLPPAEPHPAEATLRAELAAVRTARAAAAAYAAPSGPTAALVQALRAVHADQESVLRARLQRLGAREPLDDPATSPTSAGTPSGTAVGTSPPRGPSRGPSPATPAAAHLAALLTAEGTRIGASARAGLERVPDSDRALVGALLAQRGVAWLRLGPAAGAVGLGTAVAAVPGPDGRSLLPGPAWTPSAELARRLAPAAAAARYGAEVTAARAVAAQGPAARTGLAALADHAARLSEAARAAGDPGAAELGFGLPFRVTTAADVARLARHVWTAWAQAVASTLVPEPEQTASPTSSSPVGTSAGSAAAAGAGRAASATTPAPAPAAPPAAAIREQAHAEPGYDDAAALVGWLLEAELMRQRWAAPAAPFPGLRWNR